MVSTRCVHSTADALADVAESASSLLFGEGGPCIPPWASASNDVPFFDGGQVLVLAATVDFTNGGFRFTRNSWERGFALPWNLSRDCEVRPCISCAGTLCSARRGCGRCEERPDQLVLRWGRQSAADPIAMSTDRTNARPSTGFQRS